MSRPAVDLSIAVAGALLLGGLSAVGDWIWWRFIPDGAVVPGILHGLIVFFVIACVLAWAARRSGHARGGQRLLWQLPVAGALLAASFYPLFFVLGYLGALLATWVGMWWAIAALQRRARGSAESWGRVAARASIAAVASGLAFWAISGLWTNPSPGGPDLPVHVASWSFAFLPGFVAMLLAQR
ncbi:MAG: hypothetical protein AAGN46_08600 [Acidobacteriota bacterium]